MNAFSIVLMLLLVTSDAVAGEWGKNATFSPGWDKVRQSLVSAAAHPMTWGPAIAGVAFLASGEDARLAESLYRDPLIFGSSDDANRQSDVYRARADLLWQLSILATDSGEDPIWNKFKGALVQAGAVNLTYFRSNLAKAMVDRDEPVPAGGDSFPSNHATGAFAHATLIRENMKATRLPKPITLAFTAAGYVSAAGAAWGRIEAGGHHISDQLLGAAIGNFTAMFVNTAFLGDVATVTVTTHPAGTTLLTLSRGF